jgi:hypothetical protein
MRFVRVGSRGVKVSTIFGVLTAAVLLAAPSTGAAQSKLPIGEAHGVRAVRGERGTVVFVFTHRAAKLSKRIAGRVVTIDCPVLEPRGRPPRAGTGGLDPISGAGGSGGPVTIRAGKHGRRLVGRDLPLGDYCRVWLTPIRRHGGRSPSRLVLSVPLTQAGAVYLDEESKARQLVGVLLGALLVGERRQLSGWPTYALLRDWGFRKLGDRFVELADPTDTPPAGSLGYYSDGHEHVAAAVLSASGRRLFLEYDGDAVSTNVQPYIFDWRPLPTPSRGQ